MSKFVPFWMDTTVLDDGIIAKLNENRVCIEPKECGNIFSELLKYAFDEQNKKFTEIFHKDEYSNLITNIQTIKKDSFSNINDQTYVVKSYRYILPVFLSLDLLPLIMKKNFYLWYQIKENFDSRADLLEYDILNDPTNIREQPEKQHKYYDGRIELDLHKLIKQMYLLALKKDNKRTRWMLTFSSPIQIWFILITQYIYLSFWQAPKISNEQYYKQTIKNENFSDKNCLTLLEHFKSIENFDMCMAFDYTIAQLINDRTQLIPTLYSNYLTSLRKQAYQVARTKNYSLAFKRV